MNPDHRDGAKARKIVGKQNPSSTAMRRPTGSPAAFQVGFHTAHLLPRCEFRTWTPAPNQRLVSGREPHMTHLTKSSPVKP
jgi:hypothetical protein